MRVFFEDALYPKHYACIPADVTEDSQSNLPSGISGSYCIIIVEKAPFVGENIQKFNQCYEVFR